VADGEDHKARYFQYDRRVDIVSVAEVWFTKAQGLAPTVLHFERFPRYQHDDGNEVTPDFTVLFSDETALVGELSNLSLQAGSLESLAHQLWRYATLTRVPSAPRTAGGQQPLQAVKAVDVVLITPLDVMNAACDRLAGLVDDDDHPFKPDPRPMVLGWGYDAAEEKYTFVRPDRAGNPLVRDHSRSPGLGSWLAEGSDTLRGLPNHFLPVKTASRFMNDGPPPLYTATVLWTFVLPSLLGERGDDPPVDVATDVESLVARLREDYGFGRADDIKAALEFLKVARLAEESGNGWTVFYRDLGRIDRDIAQALLHEFTSQANKRRPIRTAKELTEPAAVNEPEDKPERLFPPEEAPS
jgi:hypothetical protein